LKDAVIVFFIPFLKSKKQRANSKKKVLSEHSLELLFAFRSSKVSIPPLERQKAKGKLQKERRI